VVGAEGTRVGKNFHMAASTCFSSARWGKEMEGRARARVRPCRGRSGGQGGSGLCVSRDRRRGGRPADVKRAGAAEAASVR
jgi:hypothetical protein